MADLKNEASKGNPSTIPTVKYKVSADTVNVIQKPGQKTNTKVNNSKSNGKVKQGWLKRHPHTFLIIIFFFTFCSFILRFIFIFEC